MFTVISQAPLVRLVCPTHWHSAQAPRVRLVCPGYSQATQVPKARQTERQVDAAWGAACPAPKPGSQAPGVRSPIRHASSLRLGPADCSLTICPHQIVQSTMKALTWPLQCRTIQFTVNSLTMNSNPRYNETLISFSYS